MVPPSTARESPESSPLGEHGNTMLRWFRNHDFGREIDCNFKLRHRVSVVQQTCRSGSSKQKLCLTAAAGAPAARAAKVMWFSSLKLPCAPSFGMGRTRQDIFRMRWQENTVLILRRQSFDRWFAPSTCCMYGCRTDPARRNARVWASP